MKVGVVGPTHPVKGGIAQHTTELAHRLRAAGHDVRLEAWQRQYPKLLYPGEQLVFGEPELELFEPTTRLLSWYRPDSWFAAAGRLADCDLVVIAHVVPVQVVPYRIMIGVLHRAGVRVTVISHNVLPHERSAIDKRLVRSLFGAADVVVTHTEPEAELARTLTDRPVLTAALAPFHPRAFVPQAAEQREFRRLLFFGLVRPYKGLDVLLRAAAGGPPDVRLRIAGEFWGGIGPTESLIAELGLGDRVELIPGYVEAAQVPGLFGEVDALVLPYRSATGSQGVASAFEFGVPVIVTRAGALADPVIEGYNGVIADPDDVASLTDAIRRFYGSGVPLRLRANIEPVDPTPMWDSYLQVLVSS